MRKNTHALAAAVLALALPVLAIAQMPATPATPPPGAAPAAVPANQPDIGVKLVVLYSSGVGYFEHHGSVNGAGATELRFKTTQINDILKSLVLQDLDGGTISAVNYASQEPLDRKLRSFQVNIAGNPTLGDLLGQLRGAKLTVTTAEGAVSGTILGVELRQIALPDKGQAQKPVLNLITADGAMRSLVIEDLRSIRLDDATLRDELSRALEALAGARDQDKKPVSIRFAGAGERRIRIGYVVESPVWKTSYRLIMGEKPRIQGWAIVENQTDNDWTNVQLSLVSGRPISFVQDLYQPLFIPRPVVKPQLYASLTPQEYEGGMEKAAEQLRAAASPPAPASAMRADNRREAARKAQAFGGVSAGDLGEDKDRDANGMLDASVSIASVASAARMGELFQYTVGNVSLPRQTSAMIPIVADDIAVEKVSIFNATVLPKNPLNGALLKNTTGKHLLAGPVTVLEAGSYGGDARIDNVPPTQERLLSYGVDLQMLVDSRDDSQNQVVQTARVIKGVLEVTHKLTAVHTYAAANKADADKTLIIEHPRRPEPWALVDTAAPYETTDTLRRFRLKVPAGKAASLVVREEAIQRSGIALLGQDVGFFDSYVKTGAIPQPVRDALAKAAVLNRDLVDTQRQIEDRRARIANFAPEQTRIRENMRTLKPDTELFTRLMKKLGDQESQIEQLQSQLATLTEVAETRRKALEDYLTNLSVG